MNIYLFIKQALWSIRANKLRSFLSTLWIIIWIASFVIMLSLWEWAKASILKEFAWSSNLINVIQKANNNSFAKNVITESISSEILEKVPWVENTFAILESWNFEISYDDKYIWWQLSWVSPWYLESKKLEIQYWSLFTKSDFENESRLVILWNKLVNKNFKKENPLWKKINVWGEVFIIWWLLKEKNWNFDYNVYIPDSTLKSVFNVSSVDNIEVIVKDEKQMDSVKKNLNYFLFKKSFIDDKKDVIFETRTNKEELKQVQWIISKFSLLLWWIWAISLIVWGIWIMNIMLVSVTERTREIGIRKAIWATNWNIMTQFLVESIILTLIWSIVAILLSYWVVTLIDKLIHDFSPLINLNVIMIATSVSIWMWILFWLMPAYKAAKLKPIDALHFE